jgi:hypothetical protein
MNHDKEILLLLTKKWLSDLAHLQTLISSGDATTRDFKKIQPLNDAISKLIENQSKERKTSPPDSTNSTNETRTCVFCNKTFLGKPSDQFCSEDCLNDYKYWYDPLDET